MEMRLLESKPALSTPTAKPLFHSKSSLPPSDTAPTATPLPKALPSPECDDDRTINILVVDDTNLNVLLLKHFLTKLGFMSETSTSATEGLSKLRQDSKKFSLILSDFNMPEMNGGEMCLEVRKDHHLRHLPFICSSGNHLPQDDKDKFKIDDTLMKPFTIDRLQETIGPYIGRPSKWLGPAPTSGACIRLDTESESSKSDA